MDAEEFAGPGRDARARRYRRVQLGLGTVRLGIGTGYLLAVALAGGGPVLAALAGHLAQVWWLQIVLVAAALGLGHAVLTAPVAFLQGWWVPRRYGLLHQSLAAWLADAAKAAILGGALALVVLVAVYGLLRSTPLWWLWAAVFTTALSLVIATLFPVVVVPLFYRLSPLGDPALRARLLGLAERLGTPAVDVVVVDHSRKSRTANAGLTGFGRTRRIILFDTLVQAFPGDEIEAVLAHELGHHVHRDLWLGVAVQAGVSLATFAVADAALRSIVERVGLRGLADPAGLPWFVIVLGALGLLAVPFLNWLSRRREFRADRFAARVLGDPRPLTAALDRLAGLNLAERQPPRVVEVVLHSHPSIARRIAALERWRPAT